MWFAMYDTVVALDRARQRLVLVATPRINGDAEGAWAQAQQRLGLLEKTLLEAVHGPLPHAIPSQPGDPWSGWMCTPSDERYLDSVRQARESSL